VNLTWLCDQVHIVVSSHRAEALGDAAEFQLHRYFPFRICVISRVGLSLTWQFLAK
jgi:hypothetical protein